MANERNEYQYGDSIITYEIFEDGYDLFLDGQRWYVQREPYIPDKSLSYEENAIKQIEDMINAEKERKRDESQRQITMEDLMQQITDLQLALVELSENIENKE